ncbi:MAG: peptidoglycan-binding domain-containing protein [Pseudomonadota bacterium]|nr:peptidoglycan-binding domain-containing protein [Pseudomonadota bacterium]
MAILKTGSRGAEVVRLQKELNQRLLPRPNLVPDGVFGPRTDRAVRSFQAANGLVVDGIVGPRTKAALGMPETRRQFTHRVRLNFCSISLTDVPFNSILAHTQAVFAPHGIRIDFANGMSLGLPNDLAQQLIQVDGQCKWTISGGEYAQLLQQGRHIPSSDIGVFFINRFSQAINGCGGHTPNRPACIVARAGTRWCTAHEICHVLLGPSFSPVHISDTANLMHPVDIERTITPTLTAAQVTQIKKSPLCVAI